MMRMTESERYRAKIDQAERESLARLAANTSARVADSREVSDTARESYGVVRVRLSRLEADLAAILRLELPDPSWPAVERLEILSGNLAEALDTYRKGCSP